jgi:tripartite-type tricarboxylate transporter receptor subunit TctC
MELLKSMANINLVHVPYNGAGPALTDLISGQVQALFTSPLAGLPHIKSGRLRAIAVSSAQRMALVPNLPTIAESGVPGYESSAWYGMVVPAHTPRDIVTQLNVETVRILREKDMVERMSSQGVELVGNTPEAFGQFIKSEIVKWVKIVKSSGAIVD